MENNNSVPSGRIGHISASYKGLMLVLGGYNGYNEEMQTKYLPSDELWIYDCLIEKWFTKKCTPETNANDIPPGTSGAVCSVINDNLYVFGGFNEDGNSNNIYKLNLYTFKWKLMEPSGQRPLRSDKTVCWNHNNKIYIFAGYGCVPNNNEWRNYNFVLDSKSHWHYRRGWNNQLACYDPETNSWLWPSCGGKTPKARAAHAAAKIGSRVYIFGGRHKRSRMNDIYYLDMEKMVWSEQLSPVTVDNKNIPIGRSWHSLTSVSDDLIVLYGGFSQDSKPLNDCWILNINSLTWTQMQLPFFKARMWHSSIVSPFSEILLFGGGTQNILDYQNYPNAYADDIITIQFAPKSLLRLSLDSAVLYSQLLQKQWPYLPRTIKTILDRRKQSDLANSAGS